MLNRIPPSLVYRPLDTLIPIGKCHQFPKINLHQCFGQAVDTTGCGNVFHGAYAAALIHGMSIPVALRFASVAAALKATRPGGQMGIPTRSVVEAQMTKTFTDYVRIGILTVS